MEIFDFIFGRKKKAVTSSPSGEATKTVAQAHNSSRDDNTTRSISSQIDALIKKSIELESRGYIQNLQNTLYELYLLFNKPGSGRYILHYHDKLNLGLCFAFMLKYDWVHDCSVREVWAENGFYCIQEYLDNQHYGLQGQIEGMIILFVLLCAGRDSLKHKIQDILNKGQMLGNPIFHSDDYRIGAQNVLDQLSLFAVSGIRSAGSAAIPVMMQVVSKYDGAKYFEETIRRTDLMKYDVNDVVKKIRFIRDVIGSILRDM